METRLNSLSLLIESLQERVSVAKERKDISLLEVDIILDLLRQAYLKTEELKKKQDVHVETVRTPVVQVVQPPLEKEPVNEEVPFISEPVKEAAPFIPEPVEEPEPQEIEVPQMTFAPVEITLDIPVEAPPVIIREEPVVAPPAVTYKEEPAPPVYSPKPRKAEHHEADLFGAQTIADKFKKETPSLNERITQGRGDQSLAHKMQLKPISDLKTAIGINEKFQFVNDLFDGSIESYNEAITNLNNCTSGLVAENILVDLQLKNEWNESSEAYGKLKTFITRRYL